MSWLPGVFNGILWPIYDQNWTNCSKKCHIVKYGNHPFGDKFLVSGNTAPRQNNWPEIGGHDIWKVTKIKVKKFGPHSVAPEIPEDLRKQKSYRKRW